MFRFDIALSYAGEEEGIASDLFRLLTERGARVFFAKNEKVYLFGKSLRGELPFIFGPRSKFVVPIISKHYVGKYWPKYEFDAASMEQARRGFDFILPVRVDDVSLEGLQEDVTYIDLRKEGILGSAELIATKLTEVYGHERVPGPKVWVVTFGVAMDQLRSEHELPSCAPSGYPRLCDWLEEDLMIRLSASRLKRLKLLEDSRTGETLSARIGFELDPEEDPFEFGDMGWWELLELCEFSEAYPDQDPDETLVS